MSLETRIQNGREVGASDLHLEADTPTAFRVRGEDATVRNTLSRAARQWLRAGGIARVRVRWSAWDHGVRRTDIIDAFLHAFHTDQRAALQLRCERDARGNEVLAQLWITLHADALSRFPRDGSLMNAPIALDNCPARFRVPGWS